MTGRKVLVLDANILLRVVFGQRVRRTDKTSTNIRVLLGAFVGEERGKAHLISAVGGDTEIGALAAPFANGDPFTVIDPAGQETIVSLGERPLCFRGSVTITGLHDVLDDRQA